MKIVLLQVGGTVDKYLETGVKEFNQRLTRYTDYSVIEISGIRNAAKLNREELKKKEGGEILKKIKIDDVLYLLDSKGRQLSSEEFADFIQSQMNRSVKRLVFAVGGAYGFSEEVYSRADGKISFSKMTFSHRMIRLLFTEQLYRAHTILRNEPYHH